MDLWTTFLLDLQEGLQWQDPTPSYGHSTVSSMAVRWLAVCTPPSPTTCGELVSPLPQAECDYYPNLSVLSQPLCAFSVQALNREL